MANFAKLDTENNVLAIIIVNNSDIIDLNGSESEEIGIQFLKKITGWPLWKQTSFNTRGGKYFNPDNTLSSDQSKAFRKNYARIESIYDENRNAFIPKKPYNSWILNEDTCLWESPIPFPQDNNLYSWNEENKSWDLIS
jgi:hypothetical protein